MSRFRLPTLPEPVRRRGRPLATLALAVSCLGIGAGAGAIASAGASGTGGSSTVALGTGTASTTSAAAPAAVKAARTRAAWRRIPGVHASVVVHTRQGFRTLTVDRGYVQSTSGDTLTVREATPRATYDTVSVTVPATARIRDNGHPAALSALTPGERVIVVRGLRRMVVIARTPQG